MIALEYPKIETLWNRNKETFSVIPGEWRIPEFGLVRPDAWIFQEKIDGMNIRIQWDGENVEFGGRTNNAQLPGDLLQYLLKAFTTTSLKGAFPDASPVGPVILFGEGYGPGIQKNGGAYRPDKGFILFDVRVGDWWLEYNDVMDIARVMDGTFVRPYQCSLDEIVALLQEDALMSLDAPIAGCARKSEGVVMRTIPTLRTRRGDRVIAKLKASDFKEGKR